MRRNLMTRAGRHVVAEDARYLSAFFFVKNYTSKTNRPLRTGIEIQLEAQWF